MRNCTPSRRRVGATSHSQPCMNSTTGKGAWRAATGPNGVSLHKHTPSLVRLPKKPSPPNQLLASNDAGAIIFRVASRAGLGQWVNPVMNDPPGGPASQAGSDAGARQNTTHKCGESTSCPMPVRCSHCLRLLLGYDWLGHTGSASAAGSGTTDDTVVLILRFRRSYTAVKSPLRAGKCRQACPDDSMTTIAC